MELNAEQRLALIIGSLTIQIETQKDQIKALQAQLEAAKPAPEPSTSVPVAPAPEA
jgi:hypothetical protein